MATAVAQPTTHGANSDDSGPDLLFITSILLECDGLTKAMLQLK